MPRVREITPTVHLTMCGNCIRFSAALKIVSERTVYGERVGAEHALIRVRI